MAHRKMPMISADPPIENRAIQQTRFFDVTLIVITSPFWIPVLVALSLLVLVTSGRPVLFCQQRVGRDGELFSMLKFRSMVTGDNPLVPDPSRITPIGRLLRRSSLDELPQLLNVVGGHMSLVGPRPMLPTQVEALSDTQNYRHAVRPGLTGLAQVNGRNSLRWEDRFTHDLAWAESPRAREYFHILARTIRVVTCGDGVAGHDSTDRFVDIASASDGPVFVRLVDFDLTRNTLDDPTTRRASQ